jgi:crotonobetainyl-CoA:carnitine CoA-transferase CaiB-like acyl-CoA transferase
MTHVLEGVRVLEIGGGIAAGFATRWMAGYGADIAREEGPDGALTGDEEVYLVAGKRRIDVDPATLRRLALSADIVVEDRDPGTLASWGMAPLDLRAEKPSLVVTSLTPFGQTGPYAQYKSTNAVAFAMGGQMSLTGSPARQPLVNGGSQAYYLAGLNGFSASLTAYFGALMRGQGDWLDISAQECSAGMLELFGPRSEYEGTGPVLRSGNHISAVWGIYPVLDGYAGVCALHRQIPALFDTIGDPELQDERFMDPILRLENDDELQARVYGWFADKTKAEVMALSPVKKVPFGAVLTPRELLESEHLNVRGFFDEVQTPQGTARLPGRPLTGLDWRRPSRLSSPAEDNTAVLGEWLQG